MSQHIVVYGSLRKGEYNYDRFGGEKAFAYRGTYRLYGYKMYSLGPYPAVVATKDNNGSILVDLFETPLPIAQQIHLMEVCAGYLAKVVTVDKIAATLYVYNGSVNPHDEIKTGDWKKR